MFGNRISRAYRIIRLTARAAPASASVALLCITLCVIGGTCIYNRVTYAAAAETVKKERKKNEIRNYIGFGIAIFHVFNDPMLTSELSREYEIN